MHLPLQLTHMGVSGSGRRAAAIGPRTPSERTASVPPLVPAHHGAGGGLPQGPPARAGPPTGPPAVAGHAGCSGGLLAPHPQRQGTLHGACRTDTNALSPPGIQWVSSALCCLRFLCPSPALLTWAYSRRILLQQVLRESICAISSAVSTMLASWPGLQLPDMHHNSRTVICACRTHIHLLFPGRLSVAAAILQVAVITPLPITPDSVAHCVSSRSAGTRGGWLHQTCAAPSMSPKSVAAALQVLRSSRVPDNVRPPRRSAC
jgi:hypothetical protein